MKQLTILVTMLVSLVASGQDTSKSKASHEFKRISVGVNISTDYCYRTLRSIDGFTTEFIDYRNKNDEPKIGYTAGLNISFTISKHLGIEGGIQYSNKGYKTKNGDSNNGLTFGDLIDPRYGYVYSANGSSAGLINARFIYDHTYLDIPLRVIYRVGEKKIRFVTSIGITANILLKVTETSVLEYENGDKKSETEDLQNDYKPLNISPTISVGVDYKISNKINILVEPTFRYGLFKLIDSSLMTYLWSGGLNITCYYTLN